MAIKQEVLERLLIDRALGEMSPEVETLLAEYLSREPASLDETREVSQAVELARRAFAVPEETPRTPRLRVGGEARFLWRVGARAAALAACALIGLGVGFWLFGGRRAVEKTVEIRPAVIAATEIPEQATDTGGSRFWSIRRLYEAARRPARKPSARLVWDSPVKLPRLEEGT